MKRDATGANGPTQSHPWTVPDPAPSNAQGFGPQSPATQVPWEIFDHIKMSGPTFSPKTCPQGSHSRAGGGSAPMVANQCYPFVATAISNAKRAAPVATNLPLSLSTDNKTSGFFADQACTNPITEVTIAAGASAATFYFKDSNADSEWGLDIAATDPLGHTPSLNVVGGLPRRPRSIVSYKVATD